MNISRILIVLPILIIWSFIFLSCDKVENSTSTYVTDVDGNTYIVIKLGEQFWMAENLKTCKLNDGTIIPFASNSQEWSKLDSSGFCWYNNDENNKIKYGALYNWYTVNSNKLCPNGWHVPSYKEWTELELYLQKNGYNYDGTIDIDNDRSSNNKIGKAMTSTLGWRTSEKEGAIGNTDYPEVKNKTEFNALPGGYVDANGTFQMLNSVGKYWTTTEYNTSNVYYRRFLYSSVKVISDDHNKRDGFSVRCVKNKSTD